MKIQEEGEQKKGYGDYLLLLLRLYEHSVL